MPFILLEYGDKFSGAIWAAMRRRHSAAAAAPTPQALPGPSLYSLQRWADGLGYDAYLLGNYRVSCVAAEAAAAAAPRCRPRRPLLLGRLVLPRPLLPCRHRPRRQLT